MKAKALSILFVEDDDSFAGMMKLKLAEAEGGCFSVSRAGSLKQALELIEKTPFFACLLDLSPPGMGGPGTLKTIHQKAPEMPLVVLTGKGEEPLHTEAMRLGARDCLVKSDTDARLIIGSLVHAAESKRTGDVLKAEISKRESAEKRHRAIRNLGITLSGITDNRAIQKECLDTALSATGLPAGGVFGAGNDGGRPACGESHGLSDRELESIKRMLPKLRADEPLYLDSEQLQSLKREEILPFGPGWSFMAVLPTIHDGSLIGHMVLAGQPKSSTDEASRQVMEEISSSMGDALARANAQEQVRESEARWRFLAENSPDYVFSLDAEAVVRFVNRPPAGINEDELVGASLYELVPFDSKERVADCITHLTGGGDKGRFDIELHLDKRPSQYLECRMGKVMRQGRIEGFTISASDVTERKMHELMLMSQERELRAQTERLAETNTALKVLVSNRERERRNQEEMVMATVKRLVIPFVERLEKTSLNQEQKTAIEMIRSGMEELTSSFSLRLGSQVVGLTAREIEVAGMVKEGKTSAEIADFFNISEKAVAFHRSNIRRKLNIKRKKANLHSYLNQIAHL